MPVESYFTFSKVKSSSLNARPWPCSASLLCPPICPPVTPIACWTKPNQTKPHFASCNPSTNCHLFLSSSFLLITKITHVQCRRLSPEQSKPTHPLSHPNPCHRIPAVSRVQGKEGSHWVAERGKSSEVCSQLGLDKWVGCWQWQKMAIQQRPWHKNRLNGKDRTSNLVWLMHKVSVGQWFSSRDEDLGQCLETFLAIWLGARGLTAIYWVEVRDVAKHGTVPQRQQRINLPQMSVALRLGNLDVVDRWGTGLKQLTGTGACRTPMSG